MKKVCVICLFKIHSILHYVFKGVYHTSSLLSINNFACKNLAKFENQISMSTNQIQNITNFHLKISIQIY
jgi:hypothetical protein